jgi:lipopolysaccharide export system ATP-binding protein
MSTLKAELLAKSYKGRQVVKNVGLEVEAGSIVGLLGPNGAGKTTTFYMIVGLVPSDKGKISIDDNDITLLPMHSRARLGIGYLPQESSIFRKLTVYQNLMAILETRKDLNKTTREETLNSLLDEFSIQHIRDSQGMALSGGVAMISSSLVIVSVDWLKYGYHNHTMQQTKTILSKIRAIFMRWFHR